MSLSKPLIGRKSCAETIPLSFITLLLVLAPSARAAAPIAVDDVVEHFGLPIVVDVLANDSEPDGEALTVVPGTKTCVGNLTTEFGVLILVPTGGGPEACSINYSLRDETGSSSASATVTVIPAASVIFVDGFETGDLSNWEIGS